MVSRTLGLVVLLAGSSSQSSAPPDVGCRDTHEWIELDPIEAALAAGSVEVRYSGGDTAALPEATVIVARVQPTIEAYVAHTGRRGEFAMPAVSDGLWQVNVCKAGFSSLEATLKVDAKASRRPLHLVTQLDW